MRWTEQSADVEPAPITDALHAVSALEAILLVCRMRVSPVVHLDPVCREGLLAHVRSRPTELGGLLLGRAYIGGSGVPNRWGPLICIDGFLRSERGRSSRVSLAMGTEIWDRARDLMAHSGSMVVGWYHSHPNLGAFFSGTDRSTQRAFFNRPYSVGLVVDAMRGEEAWFVGPGSTPLRLESVLGASPAAVSGHHRDPLTEKRDQ
jgi:proteasome lid subunit RPN8/RPN11